LVFILYRLGHVLPSEDEMGERHNLLWGKAFMAQGVDSELSVSSKRTDIKFSFLRNRYSGGNVAQIVNSSTRPSVSQTSGCLWAKTITNRPSELSDL
jgi:hypothetical protein